MKMHPSLDPSARQRHISAVQNRSIKQVHGVYIHGHAVVVVAQAGIHRLEGGVGGKFATGKRILAGSVLADVDKAPLKSFHGSRG